MIRRQQLRESARLSKPKTLEERIATANDHLSQGNAAAASKEIKPLLISQPDNREVIFLSAKCQAVAGDKLAATRTLEAIDDSELDSHLEALWLAAKWLIEAHQYDAAQQKLERMLEVPSDPELPINNVRVHRKLALILNNQGRRIEAAEHLLELARLGVIREKELFAMNTYSESFIDNSSPKPDWGDKLIPAMLAEAKLFHTEGKFKQARELVERLNAAYRDSTQISALQGRVYIDLQYEEKLAEWITSTPAEIQREPEYWYTLGIWLQRQDRHREAVRCLAEAVQRDETDRHSYIALAQSLNSLGRDESAACAKERFGLLGESSRIAERIGLERGTRDELKRMSDILEQLDRPWEAIAWQKIALKLYGGSEAHWNALKQREEFLSLRKEETRDQFLTCGLDLSEWPLPDVLSIDISPKPHQPTEQKDGVRIALRDVASGSGLQFQYDNGDHNPDDGIAFLYQLTGGGIGVIDFDLDGWSDLYLTQGGGDAFARNDSAPNQFFRNLAGERFEMVANPTRTGDRGYGQGVAAADINQDGFPDLVVANIGPNLVFTNNGDGTFTRAVLTREDPTGEWTTSIACGDLSGDHLPEIVEVNYINDRLALTNPCGGEPSYCNPRKFQAASDHVWRLENTGDFNSWDGCRDIGDKPSYGFGALLTDFDGLPGNELFIANDTKDNHFWVGTADGNEKSRVLAEIATFHGCAESLGGRPQGSMGVAYGDLDRNGMIDLHVTNFWDQSADIFLQRSGRFFVLGNLSLGVYEASLEPVGWGTHAVDFDHDGWLDLAVLNGHIKDKRDQGQPYKMKPQLFRGDAKGFHLLNPAGAPQAYWSNPTLGRTMAVLDWNRDGRPDLVTNHLDVPVALLENQTQGGNAIQFELVGTVSERDAIGATVRITCDDQVWTSWVTGGDGFLCSNESCLDFGIGTADTIDRIEVSWPSGATQQFTGLSANQRYLIVEGDEEVFQRR